jgi:hypothetical protein
LKNEAAHLWVGCGLGAAVSIVTRLVAPWTVVTAGYVLWQNALRFSWLQTVENT